MNTISWNTLVRAGTGIAIGVAALWLALRQTTLEQVKNVLSTTHPGWLAGALALYAVTMFVRTVRWRLLLKEVKPLSLKSVGIVLLVGYAANNLLPARLGELFRADFAGKFYQVSRSAIAGSIVVERVLDGLIVVLCLLIGRLFVAHHPLLDILTAASASLFIGIFIAIWLLGKGFSTRWYNRFPNAFTNRLQSFRYGVSSVHQGSFGRIINLSLIVWLLEGMTLWSVLKSINVSLGYQEMLLMIGVTSLSTLVPSAPGFVGTYQYAYAFTLGLFAYESAQGVAAATIVQVVLFGSVTLVGLLLYGYVISLKPKISRIKNASK